MSTLDYLYHHHHIQNEYDDDDDDYYYNNYIDYDTLIDIFYM